jgi:hypothetical protein
MWIDTGDLCKIDRNLRSQLNWLTLFLLSPTTAPKYKLPNFFDRDSPTLALDGLEN